MSTALERLEATLSGTSETTELSGTSEEPWRMGGVTDRPEYVHCVRTGMHDDSTPDKQTHDTWCGRRHHVWQWSFLDASHAALTARSKGYMLICPECAEAIAKTLLEHVWDGTCEAEEQTDD